MLVSKKRITEEPMKGATTMEQVDIEYQRSLEEFGRKWFRQGRDEGIRQGRDEGQFSMLCHLTSKKSGREATEELTSLLDSTGNSVPTSALATAAIESATSEAFLRRAGRMLRGQ